MSFSATLTTTHRLENQHDPKEPNTRTLGSSAQMSSENDPTNDDNPPARRGWEHYLAKEYRKTLEWIHKLTPDSEYSDEVEEEWSLFVDYWETRLLKKLEAEGRKPHQARKLVRRGWMIPDFDRGTLEPVLEAPADDQLPKFPVVLWNQGSGWDPPQPLVLSLHLHPGLKQIKEGLDILSSKEEFWQLVNWAKSISPGQEWTTKNRHEKMLAQAAEGLELSFYVGMGESKELGWLFQAEESDRFWSLLESAIAFGRRLALYDRFSDGELQKKVQATLLNPPGRAANPWRPVIKTVVDDLESRGLSGTAMKVLGALDGSRNEVSNDQPCSFDNPDLSGLPEISWDKFKNLVKDIRRGLKS